MKRLYFTHTVNIKDWNGKEFRLYSNDIYRVVKDSCELVVFERNGIFYKISRKNLNYLKKIGLVVFYTI